MSPTINFDDVKGLEPLPTGNYMATIVAATAGVSKNGNEKLDLQWKVEGGPNDGRIVFDTLTFTEAALFRVKATLLGLGFPKGYKGDVTPEVLIGKTAMITLDTPPSTQIDPETGEPYPVRNRVKKVKPVTSAGAPTAAKPAGARK